MVREAYVGTARDVNVAVSELRAGYGSATIIEGIDFSLPEHGALAVVGRNGMGKSTLLKTMMGYLKPSSGSVAMQGGDVTGWPTYRITRLGVAYAPQEHSLFGDLSIEDNLNVGKGRRCPPHVRDEVFEYFPCWASASRQRAGTLSGGEQKMLTLAKALVGDAGPAHPGRDQRRPRPGGDLAWWASPCAASASATGARSSWSSRTSTSAWRSPTGSRC